MTKLQRFGLVSMLGAMSDGIENAILDHHRDWPMVIAFCISAVLFYIPFKQGAEWNR